MNADASLAGTDSPEAPRTLQCMEVWGGNHPVETRLAVGGLDAWLLARPHGMAQAGGDVYYVSSCATGRITRMMLADVAGHGDHVSGIAVGLRDLMRRHINHLDQRQFVKLLNKSFARDTGERGIFATAVAFTYFEPTRDLAVCNAGHPPPVLWRKATGAWELLTHERKPAAGGAGEEPANTPLGILEVANYEQFRSRLQPGDRVLCYTDSLIEAVRADGEMLGVPGLLELLSGLDCPEPHTLVGKLLAALGERGYETDGDDLTLLLFTPVPTPMAVSWGTRLSAPVRIAAETVRNALSGTFHAPMPDMKVANVVGAVVPAAEKVWKCSPGR